MTASKHRAFWVIVAGAQPTAFRSRLVEDLIPTLKQLQRTQPSVALKWFERNRFWDSPEEAAAKARERERRGGPGGEKRGSGWRPGGTHEDPRDRYKLTRDQKRARFKRQLVRDRADEGRPGDSGRPAPPAGSGRWDRPPAREGRSDRPPSGEGRSDRSPKRPFQKTKGRPETPGTGWRPRGGSKGTSHKYGQSGQGGAPKDRPRSSRPPRSGERPSGSKPGSSRPRDSGRPPKPPRGRR